jgi:hypothetical protein
MSHQKLAMCIQTRHILTKTAGPSDAILRLLGKAPARRMPVGLKAGLGVAGLGAGVGAALAAREMLIRQLANNAIKAAPEGFGGIVNKAGNSFAQKVDGALSSGYNTVIRDSGVEKLVQDNLSPGIKNLSKAVQNSETNKAISGVGNSFAQNIDEGITDAYNYVAGLFQ